MKHHFYTCDVFTQRRFAGNQLAVFPEAEGIDPSQMQAIAREFNFSETVFVLPPISHEHTRRLRIFTPATELTFAGHPTVGAGYVLAATGCFAVDEERTHILFEEGVGIVPVTIFAQDGVTIGAQLTTAIPPQRGETAPDAATLAAILSIDEDDVLASPWQAETWSCGTPFLFVVVRDRQVLARTQINPVLWHDAFGSGQASSLFVFCHDPELPGSDVRARMYAPEFGVAEDPATGSAVAALGGYLGARSPTDGTLRWRVEQGFEMRRPSILDLEAERVGGVVVRVRVGGACAMVSEGWLEA